MCDEGYKYHEIGEKLDCKEQQAGRQVKLYAEGEIERLNPKVGGRRHQNMTFEEKSIFLKQFEKKLKKV